ncbi:MAG: hypothetical protein QXQ79_01905 [Candidatus Nanoarchaeia archaeon]
MAEFSYEDLYEILRAEKYSTDLQPLDLSQIKKITTYIKTKEEFLVRQKENEFDDAIEKVKIELENAKRALKDLYDKRERKVVSRAIFTARGGFKFKDTSNMLVCEEKLYTSLLELFKQSATEFFELFNHDFVNEVPKPLKNEIKRLKILEPLPTLLDSNLKKYGPFETNMVVELPEELAELLLTQGKAIEVREQNENTKTS